MEELLEIFRTLALVFRVDFVVLQYSRSFFSKDGFLLISI